MSVSLMARTWVRAMGLNDTRMNSFGNGRIRDIGEASRISLGGVAQTLDLRGYTVLPGLVGMHDHLFYALPPGSQYREMLATFPKLYLASGVTSLRTAGTIDIDAELKIKKRIDQGDEIG